MAPQSVRKACPEWVRLWYATLDALLDQGTWRPEQRGDLEAYVNACRLSRFHREEAERDPYRVHADSGRVFAHPGFGLARDAQREQRALADALVLTPAARKAHGLPADTEPSEFDALDDLVQRRPTRRTVARNGVSSGSKRPGQPSPDLPNGPGQFP
jgi:phage terminase small subunit